MAVIAQTAGAQMQPSPLEADGLPPQRPLAGSSLSLDQAIRIAVANHPLIERAYYGTLLAKALTKQIRGERYPWLEASIAGSSGSLRIVTADGRTIHDQGGHGFDPGGALPKHNQNMLTGGLILNQLITDFGYTAHRILSSESDHAASDKQVLTHKAQVILNVQRAYLNVLLHQRLTDLAKATLAQRQATRDRVEALYRHQLRSKLDLDLTEVEVSNAQLALLRSQNDVKQQFAALNNAMGLETPVDYRLDPVLVSPQSLPPLEGLVTQGLQARPELLGTRDKVQASDEMLQAIKALNFGSLSAVGVIGVTKYWDVHDSGIHTNQVAPFYGVGATARYPLFTGFKIQNQVAEATHRKGENEQELQQLVNEVVLQIVRAYLTQTSNAEQIPVEQQRVDVAREAVTLAQERYRHQLAPIIEVIQATALLFGAESRLAQLQYIYKTGEVTLAYAIGRTYQQH
jgi:outer membrane protein TolC